MINILLAVLPLIQAPQIKPPQLPVTKPQYVYAERIVPSGSMHGQMIAYENMQRRINEVELAKYRRFREMIRETTPPVQIIYRRDSTMCWSDSSYSRQRYCSQRKGFTKND